MQRSSTISMATGVFILSANLWAEPRSKNGSHDKATKVTSEISYLLSEIKKSPCRLNRNGTLYSAIESEKYIRRHYQSARDSIKSAEQFIAHSATRSSLSGKPYMLICPHSKPRLTSTWLFRLLTLRRSSQSQ